MDRSYTQTQSLLTPVNDSMENQQNQKVNGTLSQSSPENYIQIMKGHLL